MQRTVAAGTSPPASFHVRAIGGSSRGKGFYLLIAEPSPLRPHAVVHDCGLLYPRRDGPQTRYLGEVEVADLYRDRFRGEREQIDRLRAITSDALETVAPAGSVNAVPTAWIVASLVPNYRGALAITAAGSKDIHEWALSEHLGADPIGGFFESPPAVGVGVGRYTLAQPLAGTAVPLPARYLEAHTDGATSAARTFQAELPGQAGAGGEQLPASSAAEVVRNMLPALRIAARNAMLNCGSRGDAIVELRLVADGLNLASQDGELPDDAARASRVELARSHHTVPLAALAGDTDEFLQAARMMLADILQAFGLAEVPSLTPRGELCAERLQEPEPEPLAPEQEPTGAAAALPR
jgi:hypothetical protein